MRFRLVVSILGVTLCAVGLLMLTAVPISLLYGSNDVRAILFSSLITTVFGFALWILFRTENGELRIREGFAIVSFSWIVVSLFGSLPYMLSGSIPSFTDAYFETMSGFTTTGATILSNVEALPHGILFWRSMTQWIGGLGIILLSVAILPFLGVGGMQLFQAEVPGLTVEKLTPRISQTARILWLIYVGLTAAEVGLLMAGGMPFFDSLNHAFATLSTGGFSTKNASIAAYRSAYIEWVVILFMFLAGASFTLHFRLLRGDWSAYRRDDEFIFYSALILLASALVFLGIPSDVIGDVGERIRASLFQVVSITTTTGFVSADYELWVPAVQLILLLMMFNGGSAGSTAGGIKIVRILILMRNGFNQMTMLVHPKAVIPLRLNGRGVETGIVVDILAFLMLYITLFVFATIAMTALGMDVVSSAGAVAATLGNIGPGLGTVGAVDHYGFVPEAGKWVLSFCMLTGRLELFTVLVLFTKTFWKS
ncbi:MAG TPA: potassium transporter TrkG [Bacteroidota bacterium]|nr:potassium transporter TrkG [Bacteroidota bacterium]